MKKILLGLMAMLCVFAVLPAQPSKAADEVDGLWLSNGYGYLIDLTGEDTKLYDVTAISCMLFYEGDLADLYEMSAEIIDGELVLDSPVLIHITARPIDELPAPCADGGTAASDDPILNFEVFWHSFNDNYAFFDLHGVDWQAAYDEFRPQVTAETTPEELFQILSDMIAPLDDEHTSISSPFAEFSPAVTPEWGNDDVLGTIQGSVERIAADYLGGTLTLDFEQFSLVGDENLIAAPFIFYGPLSDTVGYVNIVVMLPPGDIALEEAALGLDPVIEAFADMETIIVDVRFNPGGHDGLALLYAGRFADQEYLAFSEQARYGDELSPVLEQYVVPSGPRQFTGNVLVLTSPATVSGAETFVMAMQPLPHVTIVGERTAGAHSDILGRTLPNGWEFGLSNEIYTTSDGNIYELVGLTPDIEIPVDPASWEAGADNILDAALALE